jgi:hypothetical protein
MGTRRKNATRNGFGISLALVAEYFGRGLDTGVEGSIRSMQKRKKTTLEKAQPGGATVGRSAISKVRAALLFM